MTSLTVAGEPGTAATSRSPMFANLPLYFEANRGQADGSVRFLARGQSCQFFVTPTEAMLTLTKLGAPRTVPLLGGVRGGSLRAATEPTPDPAKEGNTVRAGSVLSRSVRLEFLGANPRASVAGDGELPGKVNYFIGNDPEQWHTGVPMFTRVRVEEIYPGVNLVYYGNQQRLEYDFELAPAVDPAIIAIRFTGADSLRVDARGDLILSLGDDEIGQPKPVIYQTVGGTRKEIGGGYRLADKQTITFQVGEYDHSLPLVIDPVLSYSTYYGGSGLDSAWGVAVDTNGFVYVAGETLAGLPISAGTLTNQFGGAFLHGDAFVAKFDNTASRVVYLTYLGGVTDDVALSLAVDGEGNAYVTGYTDSTDFPRTNAIQTNISGTPYPGVGIYPLEAFVTKIGTSGTNLIYSTYLGGDGVDEGVGIAIDPAGNAYVAGFTESTNFPTANAIGSLTNYGGAGDAFVAKISPFGTNLVYSLYLGGTNLDVGSDVAADAAGIAYVTGYTQSTNFPSFRAPQPLLAGGQNAFVTAVGPGGIVALTNLVFSSYLGGSVNNAGYRIAVDSNSNYYVTGSTIADPNFPITPSDLNPGGIFRSVNSATTWNASSAGLQSVVVPALAVDPVTPTRLYAGTGRGIARSDDGGASWNSALAGAPTTDGFAPDIAVGTVLALAIGPVTPATIYAATAFQGVFKSLDAGTNWSLSITGLFASPVNTLAIDPLTPTTVYAGGAGGIFKSTNSAATWSDANIGLGNTLVRALALHPTNPATLYAATGGGVYRSTTGGADWAAFNNGLLSLSTVAIAIHPTTPATLYVGTAGGAFKSEDGGTNWSAINVGLTYSNVTALAIDPLTPTTVYAGTTSGVFKSSDGGGTWTQNTTGLTVPGILALAVNPQVPATLYAGTSGTSFFGGSDAFLFKSGTNGFSAVFGGSLDDEGWDVVVDSAGHSHVVGATSSTDFPTRDTSGFLRATFSGERDAFVAELNRDGAALVHAAYLGGAGTDLGYGIAVDAAGNAYVVGETDSADFPAFFPIQPTPGGGKDAFVAKIVVQPTLNVTLSNTQALLSWSAFSPEFRLMSNANLTNAAGWIVLPQSPVLTNGWNTITLDATDDALFFRLYLP